MGSFEKQQQERDVEKDWQTFSDAISAISITELPTVFDTSAVQNLTKNLAENKLFILGETHGVKENVDVMYTLFKKFGFRQLALEWEPELHDVAEKFLTSGELDFAAIQDSPDGRITAGHFALLKKLKSEGLLERLVCFDGGSNGGDWNARDTAMAQMVVGNLSDRPTLVVTGNLHAKTTSITFEDEPGEQHPIGEHIKKDIPDIASGRIKYLAGQYHNFGTQEFDTTPGEETHETRFYQEEEGFYIFEVPEAQAAQVPNPHERL